MDFADYRTATSDDLNVLSNPSPDSHSGYYGVFPHRRGFYADFFHLRLSPYCATAREAARYAAAWWRSIYGSDWAGVFRGRKADGWQALRDRTDGGYRFMVTVVPTPGLFAFHPPGPWYLVPVRAQVRGKWRRSVRATAERSKAADFLTRPEAMACYRRWIYQTFGFFSEAAGLYVRRTALPKRFVDDDSEPAGSPAGRKMAFLRGPGHGV